MHGIRREDGSQNISDFLFINGIKLPLKRINTAYNSDLKSKCSYQGGLSKYGEVVAVKTIVVTTVTTLM